MSTTEAHPSFNLVDEPWIRVLRADRRLEQVSIRETLRRAHELLDLAGEVPTQDPPVLRLLLAVLPEVLRHGAGPVQNALFGKVILDPESLRMLLFGLALILVMLYRPAGLWPSAVRKREFAAAQEEAAESKDVDK